MQVLPDDISTDLASALNIGLKAQYNANGISNKRLLTRPALRMNINIACDELAALLNNQPHDDLHLPNIFALVGIAIAKVLQLEDLNKKICSCLLECNATQDKKRKRRTPGVAGKVRRVPEEVDYEAMVEADFPELTQQQLLQDIPAKQTSLSLKEDNDQRADLLQKTVDDQFEDQYPLDIGGEDPLLEAQEPALVPGAEELPLAPLPEDYMVAADMVPPTPPRGDQTPVQGDQAPVQGDQTPVQGDQTPVQGDQTVLDEVAGAPRQQIPIQARIVPVLRETPRSRGGTRGKREIEETPIAFYDDFHEVDEYEFLDDEDDSFLARQKPKLIMQYLQDIEEPEILTVGIDTEEPSVQRQNLERSLISPMHAEESIIVGEHYPTLVVELGEGSIGPQEIEVLPQRALEGVPEIQIIPATPVQLHQQTIPDITHFPETTLTSIYKEESDSSKTMFTMREQHILSFKDKVPYYWTVIDLTPHPHTRLNITITFMCLVGLHGTKKNLKFNCDTKRYLKTIEFLTNPLS